MKKTKIVLLLSALAISGTVMADLNTGLVAHWSFDGNTLDSSVNHLDGLGYGTVTYVSGIAGQAIKFDGTSTYINAGNSSLFDVNKHSIVAWINPSDISNNMIIGKVNPFEYETIGLSLNKKYLMTWFATDMEVNHGLKSSKTITTNQWYQVAETYDGKYVYFYINGVLNGKKPRTGVIRTNTNDLAIGRHGGDADQGEDSLFFNGLIDEVSIYNRALTADEIASLYNQSIPVNGTISSMGSHTVTCLNATTSQSVTISATTATAYDCESKGLVIKPQDHITITIDGKAQ
jgi:hypothetical protein